MNFPSFLFFHFLLNQADRAHFIKYSFFSLFHDSWEFVFFQVVSIHLIILCFLKCAFLLFLSSKAPTVTNFILLGHQALASFIMDSFMLMFLIPTWYFLWSLRALKQYLWYTLLVPSYHYPPVIEFVCLRTLCSMICFYFVELMIIYTKINQRGQPRYLFSC